MRKYNFQKGIAMIELIFAIVVIGITLLSAPLLLSQSVKSNLVAFEQESIAIAAAHANTMMSYAWDEQNTDTSDFEGNILHVSNGDSQLDANATLRGSTSPKTPAEQRKRRFSIAASMASVNLVNENPANLANDVDDFNGVASSLRLFSTSNKSNEGEYIDINISIATTVNYVQDAAKYYNAKTFTFRTPSTTQAASSNIKLITTTLTSNSTSTDLNSKKIVLRSFMCNIGAASPLKRSGI